MLRLVERILRLWIRYGEGAFFTRFSALFLGALALAALFLKQLENKYVQAFGEHSSVTKYASVTDGINLWLTVGLFVAAALASARSLWLHPFVWRRTGHPGWDEKDELLYLPPEPDFFNPYRFRYVENFEELMPYVTESEYFLGILNPELTFEKRHDLYKRWYSLNKKSFLFLTRTGLAGPVALSIILPLTKCGYDRLLGINGEDQKKVIDFGRDEVVERGPSHCLLVDTFIVSKKQDKLPTSQPNRNQSLLSRFATALGKGQGVPGKRYGRTLLLRHIALFWTDQTTKRIGKGLAHESQIPSPRPISILAETDKLRLVRDITRIGFVARGQSAIDASLYEFIYPLQSANPEQAALIDGLVRNIWKLRQWAIS